MSDLVPDDKAMPEVVENGDEISGVRVFSCHFCDKQFLCPQALGGHQNAHRKQLTALKQPPLHYEPFNPFSMPPSMHVPSPFTGLSNYRSPYHSIDSSLYRRPVIHTPVPSTASALHNQFRGHAVYASTNYYPTRYQPYNFSPTRYIGSNGTGPTSVNLNPSYRMPVNLSTRQGPYFSGDEEFMKWRSSLNVSEHASSSGTKNEKDELDLTLHL